MFQYKVAQNIQEVREFTLIALDAKLYKKNHLFEIWLKKLLVNLSNEKEVPNCGNLPFYVIALCFNEKDEAIGLSLVHEFTLGAFVKEKYRRKGIASQLINEITKYYKIKDKVIYQTDNTIGINFFEKNEIISVERHDSFNYIFKNRKMKIEDYK